MTNALEGGFRMAGKRNRRKPTKRLRCEEHLAIGTDRNLKCSRLALLGKAGHERIVLEVSDDGSARICLLRQDGTTAIGIVTGFADSAMLQARHTDGSPAITAGVDHNKDTVLTVFSNDGIQLLHTGTAQPRTSP